MSSLAMAIAGTLTAILSPICSSYLKYKNYKLKRLVNL